MYYTYHTFWNSVAIVTRHDYHDYVDKILNESSTTYRNYKISVLIVL